jgi:polynucleotide 5'-kinase involved in rRNA processing
MLVQVAWSLSRSAAAFRYISDDTPMHAYLNAAFIINNQRTAARDIRPGPVIAVVGPNNCGKSSLTKILLNYAIRSGWNPLLVETDVRYGMITVPGTLSAVQVCIAQTRCPLCWMSLCHVRACPSMV